MDPLVIGAAVAAGVAVVIIIIGIISVRSERDLVEERLSGTLDPTANTFALNLQPEEVDATQNITLRERVSGVFDNAIKDRDWAKRTRQQLQRADMRLTVSEYVALHFISMVAVFALAYFVIFGGQLLFSLLGAFIGLFLPRLFVARAVAKRLNRFEAQLPDTLGLWVNALRSGYGVLQAMEAISRDAPDPTATEFRRVVTEVTLGIAVDDALDHLLERVESEDLDLVITAVNIQREVGGNLAEILDTIGHTIRERIKLKGEIRVLTSQGRFTGYLISFLPIIVAAFLSFIQPGFINPLLYNRTCGWPMIGIGLAMIGIGFAVIQKIVDIEI